MTTRDFAPTAASVRAARNFVAELLDDVAGDLTNPVRLMVSELAANCVRHAGTEFRVTVERTGDGVRVSVTDTGPGTPALQRADISAESGRGLQIVDALSDGWGVTDHDTGKTVWLVVTLDPAARAAGGAGLTSLW